VHGRDVCLVSRLGVVDYLDGWQRQRELIEACRADGRARLLLLEHPPTYTLGVRGRDEHLLLAGEALSKLGASVHRVDRGGDITFHGPGQLVGYPILDLRRWGEGPRWYVRALESMLIEALASVGIEAGRREGAVGVWAGDAKIASIGVRVSRGITSHGFALNVDPDLRYFDYIVPCGLPGVRMASMAEALRHRTMNGAACPSMVEVQDAVVAAFGDVFGLETCGVSGESLQTQARQRRGDRPVALGGQMAVPTR
jgi:lipoate-protein ligase B